MEACSLSSNSFTKTMEVLPQLTGRIPTYTKHRSKKYQTKTPFSVACCQSSSSSPHDEEVPLINSDWRSVRARLVARELISPPEDLSSVTDPDAPINQLPPITIGDKWVHKIHEPEKGCLLIATEKLDGVHIFERTVILVLSTGLIGPIGIILNRPSLMSIKEIKSPSKIDALGAFSDRPLYFGGPLEEGSFLMSPKPGIDVVDKSEAFDEVMKGLYFGSVVRAVEMMKRGLVQIRDFAQIGDFRFFDGFCAWEREQLSEEIRAGYWTVAACSPTVVGLTSEGSVGLWEEILGLMGPRKVW